MKRDSVCVRCDAKLSKGVRGFYNPTKHIVACAKHTELLEAGEVNVESKENLDTGKLNNATSTPNVLKEKEVIEKEVIEEEWYDLALNKPGQGVTERAEYEKKELQKRVTKLGAFVLKVIDEKTDERAWRVGGVGEVRVGNDLDAWASKNGARVLHSVPVGNRGSDIDHVLIGLFGVYTVNTKTHPNAKVWCQGDTIKINYGQKVDYVRNSRHEAERATKLLSRQLGWTPPVSGLILFLTSTDVTQLKVEKQPKGVSVIGRSDMLSWLPKQPNILSPSQVEEIYNIARHNTIWLT